MISMIASGDSMQSHLPFTVMWPWLTICLAADIVGASPSRNTMLSSRISNSCSRISPVDPFILLQLQHENQYNMRYQFVMGTCSAGYLQHCGATVRDMFGIAKVASFEGKDNWQDTLLS